MHKRTLAVITTLLYPTFTHAADVDVYGDALLRYEHNFDHLALRDQERMRFIGRLGFKVNADESPWFGDFRLTTGLRNKQNTPAITLYRFNQQSTPDRDIFFDRFYGGYKNDKMTIRFGKIPWTLKKTTDLFWDVDLHPYGTTINYQLSDATEVDAGFIVPMDGMSSTIGSLSYLSVTHQFESGDVKYTLSPWISDYQGESGAQYATRDTQYDNRAIRLSGAAKWQQYQLGFDFSQSISDFDIVTGFEDEKTAWLAQFKAGSLKKTGQSQYSVRWLYVERFGIQREFAQNGTTRLGTGNYEGLELRYRYMLSDDWWVGARYSNTETLVGPEEQGQRFRIETKIKW